MVEVLLFSEDVRPPSKMMCTKFSLCLKKEIKLDVTAYKIFINGTFWQMDFDETWTDNTEYVDAQFWGLSAM